MLDRDPKKIIEKASKLIGLNLGFLLKNGSWVFLRFFIMALGGWLVSLFFARMSNKEVLGQYQLVLSYISILVVFSLPGLNSAAMESVVKGKEGGVIKAVKLSFAYSLISVPIFIGWGIFNIYFKNEVLLGKTLILAGFMVPFYYAFNTWTAYYNGKCLFKKVSVKMIIINTVATAFLILGIFMKFNAFGLIAIYLSVNIIFFILFYIGVYNKISDKTNDYIDVEFGVKTSIQKLILGLSSNIPPIIIAYLFNVEIVAVFFIATYLINAISSFMGTLATIYIPALFKNLKLNHKNIMFLNIIAGLIFWFLFLIFLKLFFVLLYGSGYNDSLRMAYIISFIIILVPFKNYLITFFMTKKDNWFLIKTVGLANVIAVIVLISLKDSECIKSISYYVYAIELLTAIPMIAKYYLMGFNNKLKLKYE